MLIFRWDRPHRYIPLRIGLHAFALSSSQHDHVHTSAELASMKDVEAAKEPVMALIAENTSMSTRRFRNAAYTAILEQDPSDSE